MFRILNFWTWTTGEAPPIIPLAQGGGLYIGIRIST